MMVALGGLACKITEVSTIWTIIKINSEPRKPVRKKENEQSQDNQNGVIPVQDIPVRLSSRSPAAFCFQFPVQQTNTPPSLPFVIEEIPLCIQKSLNKDINPLPGTEKEIS